MTPNALTYKTQNEVCLSLSHIFFNIYDFLFPSAYFSKYKTGLNLKYSIKVQKELLSNCAVTNTEMYHSYSISIRVSLKNR